MTQQHMFITAMYFLNMHLCVQESIKELKELSNIKCPDGDVSN